MRILFQNSNVRNSDLEKGENITSEGYRIRDRIISYLTHIVGTLRKYGLIENDQEFTDYLKQELLKIDLETPLKD